MTAEIIVTAAIASLSSLVVAGISFWLISMKNWVTKDELEKEIRDASQHTLFSEERGAILTRIESLENDSQRVTILMSKMIDSLNEFRVEISKLRVILDMWEKKWERE